MSRTASLRLTSDTGFFDRLLAIIDRVLMTYAEITIRNGDTPRYDV